MRWVGLSVILLAMGGLITAAQTTPLPLPTEATPVTRPAAEAEAPAGIPAAQARLAYSIIIENRIGGLIRMVEPPAQFLLSRPGLDLGTVTRPATGVEILPMAAGAPARAVVAESGTDGLAFQLFADPSTGQTGRLLLLPDELRFQATDETYITPPPTAMLTDIPSGHAIFGGAYPLLPGNPVTVYRNLDYALIDTASPGLTSDDLLIIEVRMPANWPKHLVLENQAGGRAQLELSDGQIYDVATVTRPLAGPQPAPAYPRLTPGAIRRAGPTLLALGCLDLASQQQLAITPSGWHDSAATDPAGEQLVVAAINGGITTWAAPLFGGYLYAASGIEPPRRLPVLQAEVRLSDGGGWLPLGGVVVADALAGVSAIRFSWQEYDASQAAGEQMPGLTQAETAEPEAPAGFRN
ncbi:hypothetical protein JW859_03140 [bacterium]|nr:hypothetical protein [bacterium]